MKSFKSFIGGSYGLRYERIDVDRDLVLSVGGRSFMQGSLGRDINRGVCIDPAQDAPDERCCLAFA